MKKNAKSLMYSESGVIRVRWWPLFIFPLFYLYFDIKSLISNIMYFFTQ